MAHDWHHYRDEFERAADLTPNFDLESARSSYESGEWCIDEYCAELPEEPPGPPVPHGTFARAREVLLNYEFPDPSILTGVFVPDQPLEQRLLLLRARFLVFRFLFAVRVSQVTDECREIDGEPVRVWGYSYCTLEGHFEQGEITFEIWKYEASGKVEFRIHAYSRSSHIPNIFYRIGFRLFGRGLQVKFAERALERMQDIVTARLRNVPPDVDVTDVRPTSSDDEAQEEVEELRREGEG